MQRFHVIALVVVAAFCAGCRAEVPAAAAGSEVAHEKASSLRELVGGPARVVWIQDRGAGDDMHQKGRNHALMTFDTETGITRERWAPGDQLNKPLLAPDGSYIVFSRRRDDSVFRIPWDAGPPERIGTGFALHVWRDPDTGRDWLYMGVDRSHSGDSPFRRIVRFTLDEPREQQEVWRRGEVSLDSVQVSRDGTRIGGMFPWPRGMVVNTQSGEISQLGRGCWSSLAPDNSYLFWIFDGAHRNLFIHTEDGQRRWRVPVNTIPGGDGRKMYHPRWSNHTRFMALTGPYNTEGGRLNVKTAAHGVEIWAGRFDESMQRIEAWARVTDNAVGDYTPDLWIASGPTSVVSSAVFGGDRAPVATPALADQWPGTEEGLLFRWANAGVRNEVPGPDGGPRIECDVEPRGGGRLTPWFGLDIRNGSYIAKDAGPRISDACRESNELTVEATLLPRSRTLKGPARIIALSHRIGHANFLLGQEGDNLVFRLRTPETGQDGSANDSQMTLARLEPGLRVHVLVTYRDGELACYIDGEPQRLPQRIRGGFSEWDDATLHIGDESSQDRTWDGEVDGIAIWNRFVGPDEARRRHMLNVARVGDRRAPETIRVRARLVEATPVPTPEEIAPYRRALALCVYELDPKAPAFDGERRIQVYHWVILDGRVVPGAIPAKGRWTDLHLQRSDAHPQLEGERRLVATDAFDLPEFVDVSR
ncbi:MAG TPA: hypothetical protein PKE12_01605 [Kiritimatiellia bacterium]|nr:hypothetical protein [Kiritimatiellia bacterium]